MGHVRCGLVAAGVAVASLIVVAQSPPVVDVTGGRIAHTRILVTRRAHPPVECHDGIECVARHAVDGRSARQRLQ